MSNREAAEKIVDGISLYDADGRCDTTEDEKELCDEITAVLDARDEEHEVVEEQLREAVVIAVDKAGRCRKELVAAAREILPAVEGRIRTARFEGDRDTAERIQGKYDALAALVEGRDPEKPIPPKVRIIKEGKSKPEAEGVKG